MVNIKPFDVEEWMNEHETHCRYNIAETCCDSLSLAGLASLAGHTANPLADLFTKRLDYGAIRGSTALRTAIGNLYTPPLPPSNILITAGAIAANFLTFYALVGPGDHVVCLHPTYQQLHAVPASLGATVSLWPLHERRDERTSSTLWIAELEDLVRLLQPNTRMIVVNTPNNPTGAILPAALLRGVLALAAELGIIVLCDEVYAPIFHSPSASVPFILSLAASPATTAATATQPEALPEPALEPAKVIATGSLSKAYALAGIRIGWLATRDQTLLERIASARDYTTISVSQLDDAAAAYALSPAVRPALIARNIALCVRNIAVLDAFVARCAAHVSFAVPAAGTTAFLSVRNTAGEQVDDVAFCEAVLAGVGVLLVPGGRCFGVQEGEYRGYVRVGFACSTQTLEEGLAAVAEWIEAGAVDRI